MTECPTCGKELPGAFPYCPFCGSPLTPGRGAAAERKVVTVLFCDVVGFTAASESADPEDVGQALATYFAMARGLIERHGGVVEKFIGDAVVGVFGVPTAHEDDPERAVRAGLRIVEEAERLEVVPRGPLRLRVGVNTGEVLVRLGIAPGAGEGFLAGDSVNTAARIQSIAPEGGVAVGQATHDATGAVFDYRELEPTAVKGKTEPLRVFQALQARARFGTDITRTHDSPFVGREVDLALLKGLFDKTVAAQSPQLVTVVGEPGLGKSRIVAELSAYIDARPDLVTWRQGRCIPYGDGITFWALGEIVKAHAGILETDATAVAVAKLDAVLPEGAERSWFRQRLLPLLGIAASSPAEPAEQFTAWRRFLEHVADDRPTVLVFEDLHWADPAMVAFIEHLADRAEGVPLLVVATTRPELFDRYPDYAARLPNVNRVNLAPLTSAETARLMAALLDSTALPDEVQQPILDRSGGNPLYVEEYVRLLKDEGLLASDGSRWRLRDGVEVPFPDSVQALITARLDTLAPDAKSLLADAAVVGKVFWAGALAWMGDRERGAVADSLRELSRKEMVRPSRRSSIEGDAEYAFWHVLTRDVAYAQLPRPERAARHVAVATWLERQADERVEDVADVLAHHYATALELSRAAGRLDEARRIEAPAMRFLTLSGKRALGLDTRAALGAFERALAVAPPGDPGRPEALLGLAEAAVVAMRFSAARRAAEEAATELRARGDRAREAHALRLLAFVAFRTGDNTRCIELHEHALEMLASLPPSQELVETLVETAADEVLLGRPERGLEYAERALTLARQHDLNATSAVGRRALARSVLGDPGGLDDFREAMALEAQGGGGIDRASHLNYGSTILWFEGPRVALEVNRAALAYAQARGRTLDVNWTTLAMLENLASTGELDEALRGLAAYLARSSEGGDVVDLLSARKVQIRVLELREEPEPVSGVLDWLESTGRGLLHPQWVVSGVGAAAVVHGMLGHADRAAGLLAEIAGYPGIRTDPDYAGLLPSLVRTALGVGQVGLAEQLVAAAEPRWPWAEHALVGAGAAIAEAVGDLRGAADRYADAAVRWQRFGVVPEEAYALLGQGRSLAALSLPADAASAARRARELFAGMGAPARVRECDAVIDSCGRP